MKVSRQLFSFVCAVLILLLAAPTASADQHDGSGTSTTMLTDGLGTAVGSAIGPNGALYVPNNAEGTIVRIDVETGETSVFAFGLPKAVAPIDVEVGPGGIYGLAQGDWSGTEAGDPSDPGTGSLVRVAADGELRVVVDGLNLPTSMELVGETAYVVGLDGAVIRIDNFDPGAPADAESDVLADRCNARSSLTGLTFRNQSTGQSSGDLGQLSVDPGDSVEMRWSGNAAGHEDCAVSLAVYRASVGHFDRLENQQLVASDMATAGGSRRMSVTVPAGVEHMQIDAVLGRPLVTVGPNGDYYSHHFNGVRDLLIDHLNG